jgi:hypothetical protein
LECIRKKKKLEKKRHHAALVVADTNATDTLHLANVYSMCAGGRAFGAQVRRFVYALSHPALFCFAEST